MTSVNDLEVGKYYVAKEFFSDEFIIIKIEPAYLNDSLYYSSIGKEYYLSTNNLQHVVCEVLVTQEGDVSLIWDAITTT